MNARQRKQSMTRRHMQWPLGARVVVRDTILGDIEAKVSKHWREHPNSCSVEFEKVIAGRFAHRVPFTRLRLIDVHLRGQRLWYKTLSAKVK